MITLIENQRWMIIGDGSIRRLTVASVLAVTMGVALIVTGGVTVMAQTKPASPLDDKNNPELIGKRDINKGNLAFYSLDREVALGRQMAMEIDRSSKLITDPAVIEFVNRIGQNIVLHSDAKVPFIIKVVDSEEVNAFALPGGFLYVNRGLLEAAENEAEVAGVLAHEIAHVAARHGIEQASKGELLNYASLPLIFLGGLGGYIIRQVAGLAVPLTFLKFSRGAETEADRLGAQYMWATGYDPNALITFFEKLQAKNKKKPGTISKLFSTHPMTGDRITEVQSLITRFPDRGEYQLSSSDFAGVKARLVSASAAGGASVADNGRPTLKRRPSSSSEGTGAESSSGDSERPVLKRREESSGEAAGEPARSEAKSDSARESGSETKTETKTDAKTDSSESETGRPKLKRRPDSL